MQRYFITFAYDGTAYHGWQIQPNGNSVQEELQKALSTILRENIEVVGAGRTDAGVHAMGQTANFFTECKIPVKKIPDAVIRYSKRKSWDLGCGLLAELCLEGCGDSGLLA